MLRNGFVIVLAVGMLCSGLLSPVNAANSAKANAAITARKAALAQSAKKRHKHHHHKKPTAGVVVPLIK